MALSVFESVAERVVDDAEPTDEDPRVVLVKRMPVNPFKANSVGRALPLANAQPPSSARSSTKGTPALLNLVKTKSTVLRPPPQTARVEATRGTLEIASWSAQVRGGVGAPSVGATAKESELASSLSGSRVPTLPVIKGPKSPRAPPTAEETASSSKQLDSSRTKNASPTSISSPSSSLPSSRPNAIHPRMTARHAADTSGPSAAEDSRMALDRFVARHELDGGGNGPETPEELSPTTASLLGVSYGLGMNTALPTLPRESSFRKGGHIRAAAAAITAPKRMQTLRKSSPRSKRRPSHNAMNASKPGSASGVPPVGHEVSPRKRALWLKAAVQDNPVYGLLVGVTPPRVAQAFEELKRSRRHLDAAGMDAEDFKALLLKLAPDVDLTEAYVEQMMEDLPCINNCGIKRLRLEAFLSSFAARVAPVETQRCIKFFFKVFEETTLRPGTICVKALDGDAVRIFAEEEAVPAVRAKWLKLATLLSLDKGVRELVRRTDVIIGTTIATRRAEAGASGRLEQLRLRTAAKDLDGATTSRRYRQAALASCYIALDELRVIIYSSARLYAAFNGLTFPLNAPGTRTKVSYNDPPRRLVSAAVVFGPTPPTTAGTDKGTTPAGTGFRRASDSGSRSDWGDF